MNEAKSKSNFFGLIFLFVVLTVIGTILSYFFIWFQATTLNIWVVMLSVFVFGLVLALIVWLIKRLMKITNDTAAFVIVILSLAVIMYSMWGMWLALMMEMLYNSNRPADVGLFTHTSEIIQAARGYIFAPSVYIEELLYFNRRGTWDVNEYQWTGLPLAFVWFMEFFVLVMPPLMVASAASGLYLTELNAWVKERLMNYGFTAFTAQELDQIAAGDIDVILDKPLEAQGGPMNAIAVCYHKNEPTEFVAIYKAGWDKDGTLSKGRHIMTVQLGLEKIDTLDTKLQAIHFPIDSEDEQPILDVEQSIVDDEHLAVDQLQPITTEQPISIKDAITSTQVEGSDGMQIPVVPFEAVDTPPLPNNPVDPEIDIPQPSGELDLDIPQPNIPGESDLNIPQPNTSLDVNLDTLSSNFLSEEINMDTLESEFLDDENKLPE